MNHTLVGITRHVCIVVYYVNVEVTWSRVLQWGDDMRSGRPIFPAMNLFLMTEARLMLTAPEMWQELKEKTGLQSNNTTHSCDMGGTHYHGH